MQFGYQYKLSESNLGCIPISGTEMVLSSLVGWNQNNEHKKMFSVVHVLSSLIWFHVSINNYRKFWFESSNKVIIVHSLPHDNKEN